MARLTTFILLLFFSGINSLYSQEINISGGNTTTCSGFLVDTGLSAGPYGADEDIIITVCPEDPETQINLNFFIFDIGDGDSMSVYEGNSTAGTLIGTYTNGDIQGEDITSTNGCLTIHWQSDGTSEGNFSIGLSCGIPCIAPIVDITSNMEAPVLGCPNVPLEFNGSLSEFFNGGEIASFLWDFGDGTQDSISWPTVSHSYTEPGGYIVELYITDNNGCSSTNIVSLVVLIATEPIINIEIESPVCLGSESSYAVEADYEPVTWTQITGGISGGELYIPDDQTQSFSNSIEFAGFLPNETIDEVADFDYFFINMEHSYMGDLIIQFICPNGQSITVHQQEGGGTFLGNPIDDNELETAPGTGLDYWWSPTATNGTWVQESDAYTTLPSGEYQSVQSWNNLLGCPLNGTWTIEIVDAWNFDNGFVFDWSLAFDPSLYPDLINFTPEIGDGPDSTYWEIDPTITNITDDGNGLTISFTDPGIYEYTYTLVDNFGCSYSEDYEIEVIQGPIVEAGEDIFLCNEDGSLAGEIIPGEAPFNSAIFEWTPSSNLSDATMNLTPDVEGLENTTMYYFSVFPVGNTQCTYTDSVLVTVLDLPNPGIDTELVYCPTDEELNLFSGISGNPDEGGVWLDVNDQPISNIFSPNVDDNIVLYYTFPECEVNSEITVLVNHLDFTLSSDTTICHNGTATLEAELLNSFIGNAAYIWSAGLDDSSTAEVSPEVPTSYSLHIEYGDNCYTDTKSTSVLYYSPLQTTITPETTICSDASLTLESFSTSGGIAPYDFVWTSFGTTLSNNSSFLLEPEQDATYCLTITDQCESSEVLECTNVFIEQLVDPGFSFENITGCYPISPTFTPTEINNPNILEEIWSFGDGQVISNPGAISHLYNYYGDYTVTHTLVTNSGCFYTQTEENLIHSFPRPLASFSIATEIQVLPNTTFDFINNSVGNEINAWTFYTEDGINLGISEETDPSFTFPPREVGEYLTTLFVVNEFGCQDSTSRIVEIFEDFLLFAPNAITANNDGINDIFHIQGIDIDPNNFKLTIFNRWGAIVFQTNDIEKGWNGESNFKKENLISSEGVISNNDYYAQNNTYTYRIETKSLSSGDKKNISGFITVIR